MPRHRAAKNCKFQAWMTGRPGTEGSGRFIQIDASFPKQKAVKELSGNAYKLLHSMFHEAGGKPFVEFSRKTGEVKYGIAHSTFDRAVKELLDAGFIELRLEENMNKYQTNVYRFLTAWKQFFEPRNGA